MVDNKTITLTPENQSKLLERYSQLACYCADLLEGLEGEDIDLLLEAFVRVKSINPGDFTKLAHVKNAVTYVISNLVKTGNWDTQTAIETITKAMEYFVQAGKGFSSATSD